MRSGLNAAWVLFALAGGIANAQTIGATPGARPEELPADLAPAPEKMAAILKPYLEESLYRALETRHQRMMNVAAAHRAQATAPVVACFAPGTSNDTMAAFNRVLFGFDERFTDGPRWGNTAITGNTGNEGDPIVLTYSFIPDGTNIPNGAGEGPAPSDFFARMNALYGSPSVWQPLFFDVFNRWGQLIGVEYVYEPNDDGATFLDAPGLAGVRGDVRIGGKFIDGNSGILAYNYYPDTGDMVIDTADNFYNTTTNNSLRLRNVVSHEHGHGMGQPHVCPIQNSKLMEPFASTAFDGPRHDDIRAGHQRYGDVNEPNDSILQGTNLGNLSTGATISIGTPPAPAVSNGSTVSIHRAVDKDLYRIVPTQAGLLTLSVGPVGLVYEDVPQACNGFSGSCCFGGFTDSASLANLKLEVLRADGTIVAESNANAAGNGEISFVSASAGTEYFIRVSAEGAVPETQLYSATASLAASPAVGVTISSAVPALVAPGTQLNISADFAVVSSTPATATARLFSRRGASGAFTSQAMAITGNTAVLPFNFGQCGADWQYYIEVTAAGVTARTPSNAPTGVFTTAVGVIDEVFTDSFEANPGWAVSGTATSGAWTHGEPLGTGAQPETDHSADPLQNCYFTGQGTTPTSGGEADVDGGITTLTSNAFNLTGLQRPGMSFWLWFDNSRGGSPNADVFRVEFSDDNGATWLPALTEGPTTGNTGNWLYREIMFSSVAGMDATGAVRFRFTAEDLNTGSLVEAAIDDLRIFDIACQDSCAADINGDGGVDGDDVIAFFAAWDANNLDYNNDGGTDGDDVIAFFADWDSGC